MLEYLLSLQKRHKEFIKRRQFHDGDLVLMCDQLSAHTQYPLVRIIKTHPDPSGVVCNVTLCTPNTNT